MDQVLAGGCHCGQVRFEARGPALNVSACHCRDCQRTTGAPFLVRAVYPRDAVTRIGETLAYASSDRLRRHSCTRCGGLVMAEPVDRPQFVAVLAACLDDPAALAPQAHLWVSHKAPWLKLDDGLPQYAERPPA